jgi:hypothetical protein
LDEDEVVRRHNKQNNCEVKEEYTSNYSIKINEVYRDAIPYCSSY